MKKISEEKVVAYVVEVEDGTGDTMEFRYPVFRDAFKAYQRAKNNNPKMRVEEVIYRPDKGNLIDIQVKKHYLNLEEAK